MKPSIIVLLLLLFAGCAAFDSCSGPESSDADGKSESPPSNERISRESLALMFQKMRGTGWDLSKPLVWGYFFVDSDRSKLEHARQRLERDGYEFVTYLEPETPGESLMLHVRKLEVHNEDTLFARNAQFYALAEELGLDSYDGMDAGPPELDPDFAEPSPAQQGDGD